MKRYICSLFVVTITMGAFCDETNWLTSVNLKMKNKSYEKTIEELDPLISIREQTLYSLYNKRAKCYFNAGKYKEAESDFRKILSESRRGFFEFYIGKCLSLQGRHEEAYEMYVKAYKNLPVDDIEEFKFQYQYHILYSLYELGKIDEAKKIYFNLKDEFPAQKMHEFGWKKQKKGVREKEIPSAPTSGAPASTTSSP